MKDEPVLTIDTAAERLSISPRTLRREIAAGKLPVVRIGRLVRICEADVDDYVFEETHDRSADPAINLMLRTIRKNAKPRGLEVTLTFRHLAYMLERARGCCEVTGIPFSDEKIAGARMRPWVVSVDRMDITQGYHYANCRLVCAYVNLVLYDYGEDVFAKLARAFLARRPAE